MVKLAQARKSGYRITEPVVRYLMKTNITPNNLSWIGLGVTALAAALIITGHLFIAGFIVLVAGFFDMLDGALARRAHRVTVSGAVLDSTLDRISEAILLLAVLIFYLLHGSQPTLGILFVGLALVASPLVSYIRAKAEAIGLECKLGLFTRPERVITLAIGLLLSRFEYALIIVLTIIAIFSFITAGQRLRYVFKQTKQEIL
ncbi:MAG: CDP-alcohol phosphatidyltransferase family protein [Dehalococcoidales bacterium]|nr:CDP-alcohol phosphatidyltransferase family protein [Dehalococcoidales bacterium]